MESYQYARRLLAIDCFPTMAVASCYKNHERKDWVHCVVFLVKKWRINGNKRMGSLEKYFWVARVELTFHPGGVTVLLVAFSNRTRLKFQQLCRIYPSLPIHIAYFSYAPISPYTSARNFNKSGLQMVYHLPVRPLTHRLFSLREGSCAWVWLFGSFSGHGCLLQHWQPSCLWKQLLTPPFKWIF